MSDKEQEEKKDQKTKRQAGIFNLNWVFGSDFWTWVSDRDFEPNLGRLVTARNLQVLSPSN